MKAIFDRFKEPSTWAGLAALAGLFGIPANTVSVVTQAIVGVCAAAAVLMPEKAPPAQ